MGTNLFEHESNVHVALSSGKQQVSSSYCDYAWAKPPHHAPIDQLNYSLSMSSFLFQGDLITIAASFSGKFFSYKFSMAISS